MINFSRRMRIEWSYKIRGWDTLGQDMSEALQYGSVPLEKLLQSDHDPQQKTLFQKGYPGHGSYLMTSIDSFTRGAITPSIGFFKMGMTSTALAHTTSYPTGYLTTSIIGDVWCNLPGKSVPLRRGLQRAQLVDKLSNTRTCWPSRRWKVFFPFLWVNFSPSCG